MNPPPLDMKQAQECLRGAQQQLQACIELRRATASRIAELEAELAALREDKARLVEALERICTHSRDADCGDHCSNACMYCQGRAAIDAARKAER